MKKYKYEFEINDEFEPGDCGDCPFPYEESFYNEDDGYDYRIYCVLGYTHDKKCPLEKVN